MKKLQRRVRRGVGRFAERVVTFMVVLGLIFQPVGTPGFFSVLGLSQTVIAADDVTAASSSEETAVKDEPQEEAVKEETSEEPEAVVSEENSEEPAPSQEETPSEETPSDTDTPTPVSDEENPVESQETPEETVPAVLPAETQNEASSDTEEDKTSCLSDGADIKVSDSEDWSINEEDGTAETKEKVKLGVTYEFPLDKEVKVTFTCLPKDEGKVDVLKIERIKTDDVNLPDGTVAVTDYAYDITTGMENGSFKYDIVLPKTEDVDAEVSYIEKSADEIMGVELDNSDIKSVDEDDTENREETIEATDLDHFTIFIVTATLGTLAGPGSVMATVNGATSVMVDPGATIAATVNATTTGEGGSNDWGSTQWRIGTGAWKCNPAPNIGSAGAHTATFNITAPTSPGLYDVQFKAYNGDNCNSGSSDIFTLTGGVLVKTFDNPALPQACGMDVALVIDNSSSLDNGELTQIKNAFTGLVSALTGTPTQFSVTKFGTTASVVQPFTSNMADVTSDINGIPQGGGATNWKDAFLKARGTFDPRASKPNLVILATDGNPTAPSCGGSTPCAADLNAAALEANLTKVNAGGTRILILGVGNDLNVEHMKVISGTNVNTGNFLTSDIITTDFAGLATQLGNFAKETCGGTITVNKYIGSVDPDNKEGEGWTFDIAGQSQSTDSNGQAMAAVSTGGDKSVVETDMPEGYNFSSAICKKQTDSDPVEVGGPVANGVGGITVGNDDIITCDFVNTEAPKPITLSAKKVVCDNEAYLPNMNGGADIAASTAQNFVNASDGKCHIEENWQFEWTYGGTGNPGDNIVGPAGSGWTPFGSTASIPTAGPNNRIEVREIFPNGDYVPFTNDNGNNVSAEVYCGSDVAGYDNWEWITGPQAGSTYYCVAFNAKKTGSITIVKDTVPNDPQDFKFEGNLSPSPYFLDDDNDPTLPNSQTFSGLTPGTYTATEDGSVQGWDLTSIVCTGASDYNPNNRNVVIKLKAGENVTCTFTNVRETGNLKVQKIVDDQSNLSLWSFSLDGGPAMPANAGGFVDFGQVTTGVPHTITESGPDTHTLTSVTGDNCLQTTNTTATASVTKNGTTTCVFSNLVHRGSITIVKDAEPNNAQDFSFTGTLGAFSLDDDVDGTLSNSKTVGSLIPGVYSVTEAATPGWSLASVTCVSNKQSLVSTTEATRNITLGAGEIVTCTYLNTLNPFCGDGAVNQNSEQCDYGVLNGQIGSNCTNQCQFGGGFCSAEISNVTNGSFEVPDVANNSWDIYDNSEVPAWTAAWFGGSATFGEANRPEPQIEIHAGVNGWNDANHNQYVELDSDWDGPSGSLNGEPASIALSQTIPTIVGKKYTLSWEHAARPNHADNRLEVRVDGGVVFDSGVLLGGGSVNWITKSVTFTATSALTTLRFTELGTPDSLGMFLDNVVIKCITDGTLIVKKVVVGSNESPANFSFQVNGGAVTPFEGDGQNDLTLVEGTYSIVEPAVSGYDTSYQNCTNVSVVAGESATCTITNTKKRPVTVYANKIVCTNESDLPNWGAGDNNFVINSNTATDWVASHQGCSLVPNWEFQWSLNGVGDPSDNVHDAGAGWEEFPATNINGQTVVSIPYPGDAEDRPLWFREMYQDAYIPFTHESNPDNSNNISAEFYCHDDVVNYDNWEFINVEAGATYYCVAWNVLKTPDVQITKTDSPDPVTSGGILTYTLTAKNNGPNTATSVIVTDTLPAQFQLTSVVPSVGACSDTTGPAIQCELGNMLADATATVTVVGIALGTGVINNTTTITNGNGDTNLANNTDEEPTTINEVPGVCLNNTTWANSVIAFEQGLRKNGTPVLATRSIPSSVLGTPNATTGPDSGFYSLGQGGSITVKFTDPVVDVLGEDLSFHEVTNGRSNYPLETAKVEVSADGSTWFTLPGGASSEPAGDGAVYLDFSSTGLPSIQYVRITDTTNFNLNGDTLSDGYDIDAIDAKCGSGTIIVKKEAHPADQTNFEFDPSWKENFSLTDNGQNSSTLVSGTYSVSEVNMPTGWQNTSVVCTSSNQGEEETADAINLSPGETVTCVFTNTKNTRIIATKLVCDNEADLPNWGNGPSNDITANTVARWISIHPSCHVVTDWQFQWSLDGVPNPGDNTEIAGAGWNTFGAGGVEINNPATSRIWFREALKPDYLPFSYGGAPDNSNNVSAEFYCHNDVLNYDNWEWIDTVPGQTYYCVAWNTLNTGTVVVTKYDDANGNGIYDNEETTLSGWDMTLGDTTQTTAGEEGSTVFDDLLPGEYPLSESLKEGWVQTSISCSYGDNNAGVIEDDEYQVYVTAGEVVNCYVGNFKLAQVSGQKFEDTDGDGNKDGGENGLANWQIVLGSPSLVRSVSVNSAQDTPTDLGLFENGKTYILKVSGTFEAGEDITADAECSQRGSSAWTTWVNNYEYLGQALLDLELDGNPTEWGVCNSNSPQVYSKVLIGDGASHSAIVNDIHYPSNSGSLAVDVYEIQNLQTTATSEDGSYNFTNLVPGNYVLCEIQQDGWSQTMPLESCYWFTPTSGSSTSVYDFGNFNSGDLTGTKYNDLNGDGNQDEGEIGLSGWQFYLDLNGNGTYDPNEPVTTSNEEGDYSFNNLPAGEYIVREISQEGWTQTGVVCSGNPEEEEEGTQEEISRVAVVEDIVLIPGGEALISSNSSVNCDFFNYAPPEMTIEKENDSVGDEQPGNEVLFTLRVTALNSGVQDVELTDLPPEGFEYIPGSATGAPFIHEYASPGVWDLGNMIAGEVKTLTYKAKISDTQDDGLYKDLAWAKGTAGNGSTVLANDPDDSDNFVGTQVAVATDTTPTVTVPEDDENKIEEKTKRRVKEVLGASILPATGAGTAYLALALLLLATGIGLLVWGRRREKMLADNSGTVLKTLLFVLCAGALLGVGGTASAAVDPHISVQIETPESPTGKSAFKIGFVALDIDGRDLDVQCYQVGDIPVTTEYTHKAGGNSGNCSVDLGDGVYQFYVKASFGGDENQTDPVEVEVRSAPGTPFNYERDDASCMNNITFTTANDGGKTVKVELYRSLSTTFTADASTLVTSQDITSNMNGAFSVAAPGCSNDYFYAIRAVNISGFGSGFVGDEDVDVHTKTVTHTKTTLKEVGGTTSAAGAIPVTVAGASTSEGTVEGASTTNEEEGVGAGDEEGSVLGEMTDAEEGAQGLEEWIKAHPWWSSLILLVLIALGRYGYQAYTRNKNQSV